MGALGSADEVWAHNPEDTGSNPRTGGKLSKHPPICKTGTWSYWGAKHTGRVSLSTNSTCGTPGAHTGSVRHSQSLLRAPCPGSRSLHSTGTLYLLSAQVPWFDQERVTYKAAKGHYNSCSLCRLPQKDYWHVSTSFPVRPGIRSSVLWVMSPDFIS